jgi:integrase
MESKAGQYSGSKNRKCFDPNGTPRPLIFVMLFNAPTISGGMAFRCGIASSTFLVNPVTFGRVVGLWLKKELSMQAVTSQKGIRSYLRCHILPEWGRVAAAEIKPKDLRNWLYALSGDEELNGEAVRKIKAVMCAIFSFALFEELVLSNPAQGWRLKGMKSDYEPVIVPPSDTVRIIDALEVPLHKMLLLLVACIGLRASEAVGLRWGDIKDGLIHVRRRCPAALKVGVTIPDDQRFGLHSFRSSLATWMVSVAKTNLKTAQGSLRHANPQVLLDRYARAVTDEMVAAQGRFLAECGMGVEQRLLPEPATDRIKNVGA